MTHKTTQAEKGHIFRLLHQRESAFLIPNPFDIGTATLLAQLGFEALATTSAGYAFSQGRRDNTTTRSEMMRHVALIAGATDLPVSGDLENGFGDRPEDAAETIRLAVAAGLVGGSIEDATGRAGDPMAIYPLEHAIEKVRAAADVARSLPFSFTLTARCENYLVGRADLGNTIQRLQAYQEAGADVLYAPGLTRAEDIAAVVRSVDRPVNVLTTGRTLSLADLSALGVRRVSVGSALSRAALGAFLRAAREMKDHGTFAFTDEAISFSEINERFS